MSHKKRDDDNKGEEPFLSKSLKDMLKIVSGPAAITGEEQETGTNTTSSVSELTSTTCTIPSREK